MQHIGAKYYEPPYRVTSEEGSIDLARGRHIGAEDYEPPDRARGLPGSIHRARGPPGHIHRARGRHNDALYYEAPIPGAEWTRLIPLTEWEGKTSELRPAGRLECWNAPPGVWQCVRRWQCVGGGGGAVMQAQI